VVIRGEITTESRGAIQIATDFHSAAKLQTNCAALKFEARNTLKPQMNADFHRFYIRIWIFTLWVKEKFEFKFL